MKKWLENHGNELKRWGTYFLILAGVYMLFFHFYITSDYIPNASHGGEVLLPKLEDAFAGGRFLNYILMWIYFILNKFDISHYQNIYVIQIIGIALYAYAGVILYSIFEKYFMERKEQVVLQGAVLLCFVNPFMVETYVYGAFDWSVGILLAVLASQKFIKKRYILGVLLAFCATSVYQTNIVIVLIICLSANFMGNYAEGNKRLFLSFCKSCLLAGGVAALSIFLQKIVVFAGNTLSPGKEANLSAGVFERIKNMLLAAVDILIDVHGMLPSKSIFFLCATIYVMTAFVIIWKEKKMMLVILWTLLCVGMFIAPFLYGVVASTAYAPRTILALFFSVAVFGICALYIIKAFKKCVQVLCVLGVCFLILNLFYTETCIMDCYIRQALDFDEAMCIQAEIEEYEEETGIKVETIVAGKSPQTVYVSSQLHLPYEITYNYRIMHDDWSQVHFLNYVNEETYKVDWMEEEEYQKYFGEQSWDVFNASEQLCFEGNVLYWAIY